MQQVWQNMKFDNQLNEPGAFKGTVTDRDEKKIYDIVGQYVFKLCIIVSDI